MKLGILISDFEKQKPHFTSFFIAREAVKQGYQVYIFQYCDLQLNSSGELACRMATVNDTKATDKKYFEALLSSYATGKSIQLSSLSCFWIRTDWIELIGLGHRLGPQLVIQFAQVLESKGVRVIPSVKGLATGDSKLYLEQFHQSIRPRAIVTLNHDAIRDFSKEVGGTVVLKPAIGDQGKNVFLYNLKEPQNANQIFEVLASQGFIYAQEYVPDTQYKSTRLFLFNGLPLLYQGKYACLMLCSVNGDFRSNAANGGTPVIATLSPQMLTAAESIAPKLKQDGFFLSALDFVADKVVEVNQMNVGGMRSAQRFHEVNFTQHIIKTLANNP